MNKWTTACSSFILILALALTGGAQEDLRAPVEKFYQTQMDAFQQKNLDGFMALIADDFFSVFSGVNKSAVRQYHEKLFKEQDQIRLTVTVEKVSTFHGTVQVMQTGKVEGKTKDGSEWKTIMDDTYLEFLKKEGDSFRIHASTVVQKDRLANIQERTYANPQVGFSFTAPEGWAVVPTATGALSESVAMLAPDLASAALFGYVELPYNVGAKEGVEGDDSVAKKLSTNFETLQSGPTRVNDIDAYESLTRFQLKMNGYTDRERQRRRVYFSSGGLLFTFNFDAIPPQQWETYQADFDSILKSFTLSEEGKTGAVKKVREAQASGEVTGRVYTNAELGCQIAAPEGWSLEPGTLSEQFQVSLTIKPPKGDSVVRLIAVNLKDKNMFGDHPLDAIVEQQIQSIKMVGKDVTNEPVQEIKVGSLTGKSFVQQFSLEGLGTVKRKNAFFFTKDVLYMILCDAIPPAEYPAMEPEFDKIIQVFTVN